MSTGFNAVHSEREARVFLAMPAKRAFDVFSIVTERASGRSHFIVRCRVSNASITTAEAVVPKRKTRNNVLISAEEIDMCSLERNICLTDRPFQSTLRGGLKREGEAAKIRTPGDDSDSN